MFVIAVEKGTPVKGNEKEPETYTTTNQLVIPIETVVVKEINTESVPLYDVPLDKELQLYIVELCEKANIVPSLVIAIVERESNFDPLSVGDNGNSLGLMQIQPKWHQWRMDELGGGDWFNPYDNLKVGVHILTDLFHRYGDDVYKVLMAYNGGISYTERMADKGLYSDYAVEVAARAAELEQEKLK